MDFWFLRCARVLWRIFLFLVLVEAFKCLPMVTSSRGILHLHRDGRAHENKRMNPAAGKSGERKCWSLKPAARASASAAR